MCGIYRQGDFVNRKYFTLSEIYPGDSVPSRCLEDSVSREEYIKSVRGEEGREGVVVFWTNGFRIKIKSEWYVNLHRLKDEVGRERFIALKALDNTLDDAIALLSEDDHQEVQDIAR